MNVTSSLSNTTGGGQILTQPTAVKRLIEYARRRWSKALVQLNQYQRQLVIHVLVEHHGFEPKQLPGLLGRSRSIIYSDLQSIEFYKKTAQFAEDAKQMNDYICHPSNFLFY